MESELRIERLPSGLTVLLRDVHVAPVAEVQIYAQVGSADEQAGEAGLAHFHEHMLFKGTDTRDVAEIAGAIEGVGGRINAYTSFDVTCYYATLPSDQAGLGVDVLADAVQHSRFDAEEVDREIEVVLEEIRRSDDDPHSVLSDLLFETAYQVHPYRAPILGPPESVSSFTREKLRAFYERWYAPDNLVVVVAGDIDKDEMLARVEAAFADATPAGATRARPAEPPQQALRTALNARPFERACLDLSWTTVPFRHDDAPLLDLLAFVLGEGDSSRLVRRVKEELGVADRIDASSYTPFDAGLFGATADCEAEQVPAVVEAIVAETERLRREPVADEELERARANFLASQQWERESVSGMARKLGSGQVIAGDPRFEEHYLECIRAASAEDLLRVADAWLDPERVNAAAILPSDGATIDEATLAPAISAGIDANARRFRAPRRDTAIDEAPRLHAYTLDSGARVVVLPRREVPVVAVRSAMLGGQLVETEASAGLTSFLTSMWLRGTTSYSAADFARRVESLAADVDGFAGRNSLGLTLDATADRFEAVLDLFAEALLQPAFQPEELERERRDTLAALARREDRLSARVFDLFARAHYGDHPYGRPVAGTPDAVSRVDLEALTAHHERLVHGANLVVAIAGDVDPDAAADAVSRRLGELPTGEPVEGSFASPPPEATAHQVEERKDRAQSHLVLGFRGLTLDDPDRDALEVLSQVLAGQGGRLFLELRDRQSLAYTVSAMNVESVHPGFFSVYIGTAPEKLDDARAGIRDELMRLLDHAPDEAELDRARSYLIGNHAIDQQRSGNRAMHLALDLRYGLGTRGDVDYPDRIRAVDRDALLRVAQRVLRFDLATEAVIRP